MVGQERRVVTEQYGPPMYKAVWPKDLGENGLKFKRGQRMKYRMDPGKPLIEYEVLGLVWEDATGKKNDPLFVPQYYVWHYPVRERSQLWPRRSSCIVKPGLVRVRVRIRVKK